MKHISLYHEWRFTNLGYAAASLLRAIDLLNTLLFETPANYLLVQSCGMYLQSEIILTELSVLAFFTYRVPLQMLNCVSFGCQEYLIEKLPLLWKDLQNGELSTLQDYTVEYKHVPVYVPTDVRCSLLKLKCHDAASTVERHCGRDYGFGKDYGVKTRATDISTAHPLMKKICLLPTL